MWSLNSSPLTISLIKATLTCNLVPVLCFMLKEICWHRTGLMTITKQLHSDKVNIVVKYWNFKINSTRLTIPFVSIRNNYCEFHFWTSTFLRSQSIPIYISRHFFRYTALFKCIIMSSSKSNGSAAGVGTTPSKSSKNKHCEVERIRKLSSHERVSV